MFGPGCDSVGSSFVFVCNIVQSINDLLEPHARVFAVAFTRPTGNQILIVASSHCTISIAATGKISRRSPITFSPLSLMSRPPRSHLPSTGGMVDLIIDPSLFHILSLRACGHIQSKLPECSR